MKQLNGKPSAASKDKSRTSNLETLASQFGSQSMTLPQPLKVTGMEKVRSSQNPIEYHLTIQLTHETLTRRELSLLLDVLCYQVATWGCSFTMYLAMSELYFRLLGNKKRASEVKESKIRLTLIVSEIILRSLKGQDLSLDNQVVLILPDQVKRLIQSALMTKRTYGSRYRTWRPEKFLICRIVPVDIQFLERRKGSTPYSGYTKGYGESHPSARLKKTKPSSELDGITDTEIRTAEGDYLFQRCSNPDHVLCEFLLIKYQAETKEKL